MRDRNNEAPGYDSFLDIVANLVGGPTTGFGSDTNAASLLYREGRREKIPQTSKDDLAHRILDRIIAMKQ